MPLAPKTIAALHFIEEQRAKKKNYQAIADALGCTRQYVGLLIKLHKPTLMGNYFPAKRKQFIERLCETCNKPYLVYEKANCKLRFCSKACWADAQRKYEKNPYQRGTPEHAHFNYELQKKHNGERLKASTQTSKAKYKERYHSDPQFRKRENLKNRLWSRQRYHRTPKKLP